MPTKPAHRRSALREEVNALKRERVLAAAADFFYSNGYENTTLESVADSLGATKPVIYAHFSSKADLLSEICSRGISSSLGAMEEALSLEASPGTQLRYLTEQFVQAVLANSKYIAIMVRETKNLSEGHRKDIIQLRREFDQKLRGLLQRGMDTREFRIIDCELAALAISGMVSWSSEWYRPQGKRSPNEIASGFSNLVLNMVGLERSTPVRLRNLRLKKKPD